MGEIFAKFALNQLVIKKTLNGFTPYEVDLSEQPAGYYVYGQNIKRQYEYKVSLDNKYLHFATEDKPMIAYTSSVGEIGIITENFYRSGNNGAFQGLFPIKHQYNYIQVLYLLTVLKKYFDNFGYATSMKNILDIQIYLPVGTIKKNEYTVNDIDWQYIQDRITELKLDCIIKLDLYLKTSGLDDCELTDEDNSILNKKIDYKSFKVKKVFKRVFAKCKKNGFDKRKDTSTKPTNEFSVPLVNAKLGDNGIMFYGRKEDWDTQNMCIDIIQNGAVATGTVYAQPQSVAVLWDAYLIKPIENINSEEVLLYLSRCIEKITKERFSYDKKATWDRVKECEIYLPVKSNGNIDYDYMERYIKAIEKVVIADVVKYKNAIIETMKKENCTGHGKNKK